MSLIFEIQRSQRMLDRDRMAIVGELEAIAGILRQGQAGELRADLDPEVAIDRRRPRYGRDEPGARADADRRGHARGRGGPLMQLAKTVVELFVYGMAAPSRDGATGSRATPSPAPATD